MDQRSPQHSQPLSKEVQWHQRLQAVSTKGLGQEELLHLVAVPQGTSVLLILVPWILDCDGCGGNQAWRPYMEGKGGGKKGGFGGGKMGGFGGGDVMAD